MVFLVKMSVRKNYDDKKKLKVKMVPFIIQFWTQKKPPIWFGN
jgi:hypothetical protein